MPIDPASEAGRGKHGGNRRRFSIGLPPGQRRRIERAAVAGYPNEACGLLIGRADGDRVSVERVTVARNLSAGTANDRYQIDPDDFLTADALARRSNLDVVGVWHSHPDHPPVPSSTDLEAAWAGYAYLIVSVISGRIDSVRSWRLREATFTEERIES